MPIDKATRKARHEQSYTSSIGRGDVKTTDGSEGDQAFRRIEGKGLVHQIKISGKWHDVGSSSSGTLAGDVISSGGAVRGGGGGGGVTVIPGITDHGELNASSLSDDDHPQYMLDAGTSVDHTIPRFDGTDGRTMQTSAVTIDDTNNIGSAVNIDGSGDLTVGTITMTGFSVSATGDLSLGGDEGALKFTTEAKNSIEIPDDEENALVIEEANNAYLTFVTTNDGEKITLGKKLEAGSVEIEGQSFDINGGDISSITISGGLTWSAAQDLNNQNLTNVDIDSGAIDGTTVGASSQAAGDFTAIGAVSAGTIVGTTIDATTDFTVGNTVITTSEYDVTGAFTLDGSAGITIDSVGSTIINTNGAKRVDVGTDAKISFHNYGQTLYQGYALQNKATKYHFTTGEDDLEENYSMLSYYEDCTSPGDHEAYPPS